MPNSQETTSPQTLSRVIIWPIQAAPGNKPAPKGLPNTSRFCPGSPKQLPLLLNTETTTVTQHSEGKKHKRNAQKLNKRLCRIRKPRTQQEFVTVTKLTVSLQRGQGSDSASYTILASKDCQKYSRRDTEEAGQLIQDPVGRTQCRQGSAWERSGTKSSTSHTRDQQEF